MPQLRAVRGMHDLWGLDTARLQAFERIVRTTLESFGYGEIRTPVLEKLEVFSQTIGDDTDIVEKQMYEIKAPEGDLERLVMRPEGTAPFIRAVLEHRLDKEPNNGRFYYLMSMFRHERPQKGRLRQFHQFGAEAIGDASPEIDAELIFIFDVILKKLRIQDYRLEINSVGCNQCRPAYRDLLLFYFTPLSGQLCTLCQARLQRAPMRIFDCKNPQCIALTEGAPTILSALCDHCTSHHDRLKIRLTQLEVAFHENHKIVRGLDYYSRTAFEFSSTLLGAQSALGGGGRYDGLAERFGGECLPAVGWALGIERFMIALEHCPSFEVPDRRPLVFFVPLGVKAYELLYPLSLKLRAAGIAIEMIYEQDKKLKWLLKQADRAEARYALILGDDEYRSGNAILKDMKHGTQEYVAIGRLEDTITKEVTLR